jgi:hypothetical protein
MGKRKGFPILPLLKKDMHFEVPERPTILRYLYGDVLPGEMEAAAYWEYCRLNQEVLRIANLYQQAVSSGSGDPIMQTMIEVSSNRFMDWPWGAIWQSPSFPAAPWIGLTAPEKNEILLFFISQAAVKSLPTWDVRILDGQKVFNHWQNLVINARKASARQPIAARCAAGDGEHIVFTLNYREGLERTEQQFAKWLRQPEQAKLFAKYQKQRRGRDKGRKKLIDMLRTLAIRRVFECAKRNAAATADWLIRNQQENRKYPERRRQGFTERDIRRAVERSSCYEMELFSTIGLKL